MKCWGILPCDKLAFPVLGGSSNTPTHFMQWKPCMISSAAWANLLEYKQEIE